MDDELERELIIFFRRANSILLKIIKATTPDFSEEDAELKAATKKAQDELNKISPQTN